MKKNIFAAVLSIASLSAGSIFAVGPDSSGSSTQDYSYILDSGNSISISRFTNSPKVTGTHPEGYAITNGYKSYSGTSISAKWDYSGTVIGISTGTPYITDLTYKDGILTNAGAKISSNETAIVASRSVASGFKVFGGIRLNQVKATVNKPYLGGAGNPTFSVAGGYQYELDTGTSTGFALGAAYEVPQIMLRASIQYNSEIKHSNAKVTETLGGAATASSPDDVISPSSMIIKLRSALSPRMLAFANWRSSQYKKLTLSGPVHTAAGQGLIYDPESGTDYTLGVALKVNDSLNVLVGTAKGQATDTGANESALAPFKGNTANFIGATFKISDNVEINGGYSLITLGDATATVPLSTGVGGNGIFADNKSSRVTIGTTINF